MADLTSSTQDNLDPSTSNNQFGAEHKLTIKAKPGEGLMITKKLKLPGIGGKIGMPKSMGAGTRKSTTAPKGSGSMKKMNPQKVM